MKKKFSTLPETEEEDTLGLEAVYESDGDPREGQYLSSLRSSHSLSGGTSPLGEREEELESEEVDEEERTWEAVEKEGESSRTFSSYVDAEEEETW